MSVADIATLATALAGLLAAFAQWAWLVGPRRNGQRARLPTIEARLTETEDALHQCLRRLRNARRHERRRLHRHRHPPTSAPAGSHGATKGPAP